MGSMGSRGVNEDQDELKTLLATNMTKPRYRSNGFRSNASYFLLSFGISVAMIAIGAGVGIGLLGRETSVDCVFNNLCFAKSMGAGGQGCFTFKPFAGVLFILTFIPAGIFYFCSSLVELSHMQPTWGTTTVQLWFIVVTIATGTCTVFTWLYMLRPKTLYKQNDESENVNDGLLVLIGGFFMWTMTGLTLTTGYIALRFSFRKDSSKLFLAIPSFHSSLNRSSFNENAVGVLGIFLLITVLSFVCSTFSSVWNYSARSYFMATSPYSVIENSIATVNQWFTFKVYKDVIVFYGYLFGIVLLGFIVHVNKNLRNVFHTRLRFPYPVSTASEYHPFPTGITVGEATLLTSTLGLGVYWMYYWRFEYSRIIAESDPYPEVSAACCNVTGYIDDDMVSNDDDGVFACHTPADPHGMLQIWARVFGHLSTFALSFCMFPVAKNSIWEFAFGIPFERAIKYHRMFGAFGWILVTIHMAVWQVKWAIEGTLWSNIVTINDLRTTPFMYHWDNFTIVLAETAWFGLTVSLAVALTWRTHNYTLFHYVHLFTILFFIVAIVHAWSFWYYAIGGLFLWFADRMLRVIRRTQVIPILSISYCKEAGVTRIVLPNTELKHEAGQFAYINVPLVSNFEWHPFTISSHPSAASRSFHIKEMSKGSWTEKLARLAATNPQPNLDVSVRFDGPYGRCSYYSSHSTLLFVGGGIGITPLISVIAEIYSRYVARRNIGSIRKVKLVWMARNHPTLLMFAELLKVVIQATPFFDISLYCTAEPSAVPIVPCSCFNDTNLAREAAEYVAGHVTWGRPDLRALCSSLPPGRSTMVLVCGPVSLITTMSELAFAHNFSFHEEIFNF